MKVRLLLAVLLMMALATPAMAAGPYVGASGGISVFHESNFDVEGTAAFDTSFDIGAALNLNGGWDFDGVRVDAEFGYKGADIDKGFTVNDSDLTIFSWMVNGYYDFKTSTKVKPFVGAGIGVLNGEVDTPLGDDDDTAFAYQLTAGVAFKLNKNFDLDVMYRFQGAGSDLNTKFGDISYHSSNILAGVRYRF